MPDPLGPLAAAALLEARLADAELGVPHWWDVYRRLEGFGPVPNSLEDNNRLPAPRFYATEERARLEPEQFPAAIVVPQDTGEFAPAEVGDDGRPRWQVGYRLRTFLFVRGANFEECSQGRHRLCLATRSALIAKPRLGDTARVQVASISESYSSVDVTPRDGSTIAGCWLQCTVLVDEVLPDEPIGTVEDVGAAVEPLP